MPNRRKNAQNCWIFERRGSLPQPLPKGKGFSNFDMRLYMRVYMTPPRGSALDAVVYGLCTASCIVLRTLAV